MPWRGHTGGFCHGCGRHVSEVGRLSARYKCNDCGEGAMLRNVHELREHTGESLEKWRRGMAAAVGAVLVDERGEQG
jgi:hypothetical protein